MFERLAIEQLSDYFLPLVKRKKRGVFFIRLNSYNKKTNEFLQRFYETARKSGVIIEGKINNPGEKNLSYYSEIMGMDFKLNMPFLNNSLKKWLPRMKDNERAIVSGAIYDTLYDLHRAGKNENMMKNAYIKFMCWLYYKFERIVNILGENDVPKILYEGYVSNYELLMLNILSLAGCDILLLQYSGDDKYLKVDPDSKYSSLFREDNMGTFPENFSLKVIRKEIDDNFRLRKISGVKPKYSARTNSWINGSTEEALKMTSVQRGIEPEFFYNCFFRVRGVDDKLTYANKLYTLNQELRSGGRCASIVENQIPIPTVDEISAIQRNNNTQIDRFINDLAVNIEYPANNELKLIMKNAFIEVMTEFAKKQDITKNKLNNTAVYVLCWIKRYQKVLFNSWKIGDIGCFIYLGGCKNVSEALFVKILSRMPVDVLILIPNLSDECCLEDENLLDITHAESMELDRYPSDLSNIQIGTAAYVAERELDTILYNDSGMFRSQQFEKANSILLRTMYEEIRILWNQELKYRPNFSTVGDTVNMPVIFSKVSGVKNGNINAYWKAISELLTDNTILIQKVPYINSVTPNPIKAHAVGFIKNGKLQRSKICNHPSYKYGFLRQPIQEYMLDKLQQLLDSRRIRGTFVNGTEYTIISVALNLNKRALRLIQSFDFTKKNPKLVYLSVGENVLSLEDAILLSYLSLLGFDVVLFVPTGYQSIEAYFENYEIEEHQTGEYMYDLEIPDLTKLNITQGQSLYEKIFRRGV